MTKRISPVFNPGIPGRSMLVRWGIGIDGLKHFVDAGYLTPFADEDTFFQASTDTDLHGVFFERSEFERFEREYKNVLSGWIRRFPSS